MPTRITSNPGESAFEKLPPELWRTVSSQLSSPKDKIALANTSPQLQGLLAADKKAAINSLKARPAPTVSAVPASTGANSAFGKIVDKGDKYRVSPLHTTRSGQKEDIQRQQRQEQKNALVIDGLKRSYPDLSIAIEKLPTGQAVLAIANRDVNAQRPATLYVTATEASQTIRSRDAFRSPVHVSSTLPEGHKIRNYNKAQAGLEGAIAKGSHGTGAQYERGQVIPQRALATQPIHENSFKTIADGAAKSLTQKGPDNNEPAIFVMPVPGQRILLSQVVDHFLKFPVKNVVVHGDTLPDEHQMRELNEKRQNPVAKMLGGTLGTMLGGVSATTLAWGSNNNAPDSDYSKSDTVVRFAAAGKAVGEHLVSRSVKYDAPSGDPQFGK